MKTTIKATAWNTYALTGYTCSHGSNPAAQGGVNLYQVRKTARGWQRRVADSNGRHFSAGPAEAVSDAEGEELFRRARERQ